MFVLNIDLSKDDDATGSYAHQFAKTLFSAREFGNAGMSPCARPSLPIASYRSYLYESRGSFSMSSQGSTWAVL